MPRTIMSIFNKIKVFAARKGHQAEVSAPVKVTRLETGGESISTGSLTTAEKAELGKLKRKEPHDYSLDHITSTEKQVQLAIERAFADGMRVSAEDKRRVAELDAEHAAAWKIVIDHTHDKAVRAFKQQFMELQQAIREGRLDEVKNGDAFTRADYLEDYERKRKAAKDLCRKASAEAQHIAMGYVAKVAAAAGKIADELEAEEKKRAEHFGLEYVPSRVVLGFRKLAKEPTRCMQAATSAVRPSAVFNFLTAK